METPIAKRTRAAPSPLKGTSPAADRGLVEQADILDRVLPDDDDTVDEDVPPESSDEDEDDVPPPPDETEEAEEGAPAPAPAPARGGRRPKFDYYGEKVVVHKIDATSEKDPAVVAKLDEIFSVDAAGYQLATRTRASLRGAEIGRARLSSAEERTTSLPALRLCASTLWKKRARNLLKSVRTITHTIMLR